MSDLRIEWAGDREMLARLDEYGRRVQLAVRRVAQYWSPVVEAYAKDNAPWTDRTGNARQGLQGLVEDMAESSVAIVLKGGVDYQIYLETRWAGRYAIILPTLEAHYDGVMRMVREIFA